MIDAKLSSEEGRRDAIAIIGIGCRYPGGARDPRSFWDLICQGVDAITEVPSSRFDLRRFHDPRPRTPGRLAAPYGAFVDSIDSFDAAFFGISPREAVAVDPQQRMLLEVAWEAFEDAGIPLAEAPRSEIGVFLGMSGNEYEDLLNDDPERLTPYALNGGGRYGAGGRVSFGLGLGGPSMVVDTACSSSLVSIHLACQSLRAGECKLALAGGSQAILKPHVGISLSQADILAPDGHCKFGDASANGYVRSEGAGLVLLKPYAQALADGDRIYAIIRGSAINNDGASSAVMAKPAVEGQMEMLRRAYRDAGISPGQVHYVEAHGTGTVAGDQVELLALGKVLGEGRDRERPCIVGSVKTNIGHAEGASGVAGLIKLALCLQHRTIPPSLHFREPTPNVPWAELPLVVQQELGPLPTRGELGIGGVNSFGLSGTNAHIVLQEVPARAAAHAARPGAASGLETRPGAGPGTGPGTGPAGEQDIAVLLPLSARSDAALRELAQRYASHLDEREHDATPGEIAAAASLQREHLERRLAVVGRSRAELVAALQGFARGEAPASVCTGRSAPGTRPRIAFVFPGMGASWVGVGRQLLASEPAFRAELEAVDKALRPYLDVSVLALLTADEGSQLTAGIDVFQPALFALEAALCALWRSWGIRPDAVIGHSMGEVVAAYVAGMLTLDDAARVICGRSRLLAEASGRGAMVMVELPAAVVVERLGKWANQVAIAVINSAQTTVLSGDPDAIEAVIARLTAEGVFCRRLKVDIAFHSPQMDPLLAPLRARLARIAPRAGTAALYSTVTGGLCDGTRLDAEHWVRNLRAPVEFGAAIERMAADGHTVFIEVGPHPILRMYIEAMAPDASVVASLRRGEDERVAMRAALGETYVRGCSVRWRGLYPVSRRDLRLPTYPWQRERYWVATPPRNAAGRMAGPDSHPLLGAPFTTALSPGVRFFERQLHPAALDYLADTRVQGAVLLPSAAVVEMALAAASQMLGPDVAVRDLVIRTPLALPEDQEQTVQVSMAVGEHGRAAFQLASMAAEGAWTVHASAAVEQVTTHEPQIRDTLDALRVRCAAEDSSTAFYQMLARRGLEHGPALQGVRRLWRGEGEVLAEIELPCRANPAYRAHPALLEAAFHVLVAALPDAPDTIDPDELMLPAAVGRVQVYAQPEGAMYSHAALRSVDLDAGVYVGEVRVFAASGQMLVEVDHLRLQRTERNAVARRLEDLLIEPTWQPEALPEAPARADRDRAECWLLLADDDATGNAMQAAFERQGRRVVRVATAALTEPVTALRAACPAGAVCRGVVYLCSTAAEGDTADAIEAAQAHGAAGVLALVQGLAQTGWSNAPRLWLVTRGTQAIQPGDAVTVAHAPVWGLGRTLGYEHPELRCTLVDLEHDAVVPGAEAGAEAEALVREVLADDAEQEIALRSSGRHVARLIRGTLPAPRPDRAAFRAQATYLITGGLGGLGLSIASWMVEQGARQLVLAGRRGATTPAQHQALAELRARGAAVHAVAVDVADEASLAGLLDEIARTMPQLRGIIHAAGVLDDGVILQQTAARLRGVMAPKVRGAWNLHRLTQGLDLDFFVLYSSVASLLGSPGQSNYAAANAFLDALAHHRRALGLPALSIAWGAFAEVGMAAANAVRGDRLGERGMGSLGPHEGTAVLGRLLAGNTTQLGVAALDIQRWTGSYPHLASTPRLLPLLETAAPPAAGERTASASNLRARLIETPEAERLAVLEGFLQGELARVLRIDAARIERSLPLPSLGIDSLMALELRNRIEAALGVRVQVLALLQGADLVRLAERVLERLVSESVLDSVRDAAREALDSVRDATSAAADDDSWEVITL